MAYAGWVMALALGSTLATFVYRTVSEAMHDQDCRTNLKRIGAALQQYHDRCGSFPPAYVLNKEGQRWHSWRVLLLPDLGYADLYAQYRFDEPWDGPHNRQLLSECRPSTAVRWMGNEPRGSELLRDRRAADGLAGAGALTLSDKHITDGTSNTAQLIESVDTGITWLEPRDLNYADLKNGAYHPTRVLVRYTEKMRLLFVDGSLQLVEPGSPEKTFRAICTPAGGRSFPGVAWQLPVTETAEIQSVPRRASELPKTAVLPYLNSPFVPGRNSVYRANFQLAWDRLREDVLRAPVELEGAPEMVRELNQRAFPRTVWRTMPTWRWRGDSRPASWTTSGRRWRPSSRRSPRASCPRPSRQARMAWWPTRICKSGCRSPRISTG